MKFSLFMMPLHHPTESPSLAFDRDISLIHLADELGYDECFIGDPQAAWRVIQVSPPHPVVGLVRNVAVIPAKA